MSKSRPRCFVVSEVSICVKIGPVYQVWNIVPQQKTMDMFMRMQINFINACALLDG